jgi:hypothetical protein
MVPSFQMCRTFAEGFDESRGVQLPKFFWRLSLVDKEDNRNRTSKPGCCRA